MQFVLAFVALISSLVTVEAAPKGIGMLRQLMLLSMVLTSLADVSRWQVCATRWALPVTSLPEPNRRAMSAGRP